MRCITYTQAATFCTILHLYRLLSSHVIAFIIEFHNGECGVS